MASHKDAILQSLSVEVKARLNWLGVPLFAEEWLGVLIEGKDAGGSRVNTHPHRWSGLPPRGGALRSGPLAPLFGPDSTYFHHPLLQIQHSHHGWRKSGHPSGLQDKT